ncbi:TlpA family protein disulfide reductase [Dissulfuribacter thermophilus]|uniref:TlpA family protein disulfide reductase n=1 Tax=Dissulfuribacter thermophilus TaxID=1156395 RepID=UPI00082F0A3D|nr:TlpA disulfide reductase family protein [Dissulfuribacter thermophilus]
MKKIVSYVCMFVMTFLFLSSCNSNANSYKAPNFTLLNLEGDVVKLSNFKGKVVLLNFFATYCPPCRYEIPDFVKLQQELGPKGFQVIGVSVDENGEKILPYFVEKLQINYPVLLATTKVLRDYGNIYALPQSFLIGKDQTIIKHYIGMVTEHELRPLIEKALDKNGN